MKTVAERLSGFAVFVMLIGAYVAGITVALAAVSLVDLQLANPVVPRQLILSFAVLVPAILLLRFSGQGYAFRVLIGFSFPILAARVVLLAIASTIAAIGLFNPVKGAKVYVIFEKPRAVGTAFIDDAVLKALEDVAVLRDKGVSDSVIKADTSELTERILACTRRRSGERLAFTSSACVNDLIALVSDLRPLEQRLREIRQSKIPAGSTISVYSPNGYPSQQVKSWPFPSDTTRSVWVSSNDSAGELLTEPRISSWVAWHDPAVKATFNFELKLPSEVDGLPIQPPAVSAALFSDPKTDCALAIAAVRQAWQLSGEGTFGTIPSLAPTPYETSVVSRYSGVFTEIPGVTLSYSISDLMQSSEIRHLSYAFDLPSGRANNLCLQFDWASSAELAREGVKFDTKFVQSIPVSGRVIALKKGEGADGAYGAVRSLFLQPGQVADTGRSQVLFDSGTGIDEIVVAAQADGCLPSLGCLIVRQFVTGTGTAWTPTRGDLWSTAPNSSSWIAFRSVMGLLPGVECGVASSSYVDVLSEPDGNCRSIAFERDDGRVELYIPELGSLYSAEEAVKNEWRHLIAWSATAAWRRINKNSPAFSYDRAPTVTDDLAFGWSERRGSLIDELLAAIGGELGWRDTSLAQNNVRAVFLFAALFFLSLAGTVGTLSYELLRSIRFE